MIRRLSLVLVTASGVLLGGAVAASASTVGGGGSIVLADVGEQNGIVVNQTGSTRTITDTAGITSSPGCIPVNANEVTCTIGAQQPANVYARDGSDLVQVIGAIPLVNGGAGDDVLDVSQADGSFAPTVSGFSGNDRLIGSPGADQIDSQPVLEPGQSPAVVAADPPDAGDDTMIGNAGGDYLNTGRGADTADGGDGDDYFQGSVVPYDFPTPPNLVPTDDRAVDNISCGAGTNDQATIFAGDLVGIDCEQAYQVATCPASASVCVGTAEVTAKSGAGASAASATAAAGKKGKKSLGKSRKTKIKGGQTKAIKIPLKRSKVRKAIGGRSELRATIASDLVKMKGGKEKGHVRRRARFKFKK